MRNDLRYFIVFFLFIFPFLNSYSNTILCKGNAPSYKGETLRFYTYPDLITGRPEDIGFSKVNEEGDFKIEISSNFIIQVHIELGKYDAYIYAEPGMQYELVLPPRQDKTTKDFLNPYFQPQKIHLGVSNIEKDDLNILIQEFDQLFIPFLNEYALHKYAGKSKETDRFRFEIDSIFSGYSSKYFQEYVIYKLSLLDFIKYSGDKQTAFYSKFPEYSVSYNNPGFSELFNLVYSRFLYNFSKIPEGDIVNKDIHRYRSYDSLRLTIEKSNIFQNDSLLELTIIKGLYDEFFRNDYPKESLLLVLENMKQISSIEKHRKIIENILWKVTRLDEGEKAPDFQLYNSKKVLTSLDDFKGKYVYLNFISFQSYACQVQFPILNDLAEEFKDSLIVISISVDESFEEMVNQVDKKNYSWPFLHIGNNSELLYEYDIRGYPMYFLLDQDGVFMSSPAPSPVEGFETFFRKNILKMN